MLRSGKRFIASRKSLLPGSSQYFSSQIMSGKVIFLRHGQSTWNRDNKFIGMADPPLTPRGETEAKMAGRILDEESIRFDCIYSSVLRRCTKTAWLVMEELGVEWTPIMKDWRLNERSYGALVGQSKKDCVEEFGKDQVKRWRRSWDEPPPPQDKADPEWPGNDPRYASLGVDPNKLPLSESLKDLEPRTTSFWNECIIPNLQQSKTVLVVGHENNLRSILKRIDMISNKDILELDIPRAVPLLYNFNPNTLLPVPIEGSAPLLSGKYLSKNGFYEKLVQESVRSESNDFKAEVN